MQECGGRLHYTTIPKWCDDEPAMTIQRTATMRVITIRRACLSIDPFTFRARCPACNCEVEMFPADRARTILDVDETDFDRLLTAGIVHSILTVSGSLWVCKESLIAG
jgi:hypothetical protein